MENDPAEIRRTAAWLACFAVAMGFAEAAVVVYLRELYYPAGFAFPLKTFPPRLLAVETLREVSTILMLAGAAMAAGRDLPRRLAAFLFCFGVWDIFYYVFLKLLLGWPPSLLTWDLLFLIPVAWAGPVLAPVICSLTMMLLAGCIVKLQAAGRPAAIKRPELALMLAGAALIFFTFIRDYGGLLLAEGMLLRPSEILSDPAFQSKLAGFAPAGYSWGLFAFGELLALAGIFRFYRRA